MIEAVFRWTLLVVVAVVLLLLLLPSCTVRVYHCQDIEITARPAPASSTLNKDCK